MREGGEERERERKRGRVKIREAGRERNKTYKNTKSESTIYKQKTGKKKKDIQTK